MSARPLLLGHRGARKYAPENTIAAFDLSLEDGCDGFEFDVRVTADKQAVICHDTKLRHIMVARSTMAKLRERCADLATLEVVMARFQGSAFLNVEIKVAGAEEPVIAALRKFPPKRGAIVSSFSPAVVRRLRELEANLDLGIICENRRQLARWKELPIQAVMVERKLLSAKVFDEWKAAGKQVFVWTVNSAREMKNFAAMGVDGIISDDTRLLAGTLGAHSVARANS
jgi:glycerophosphoryl diester phosphodiesterase